MTTEQNVSVTILPGQFEVTVIDDYLLVSDLRGGSNGWRIVLKDASVRELNSTTEGSAPGLHYDESVITKNNEVGPGDSTGGQWLFSLDRAEVVGVELTIGKHTVFWVVPSRDGLTRKFDHGFSYE